MKNMLAIASLCLLSVAVAAGLAAPQSSTVEGQVQRSTRLGTGDRKPRRSRSGSI